jgi:hypothetical protein
MLDHNPCAGSSRTSSGAPEGPSTPEGQPTAMNNTAKRAAKIRKGIPCFILFLLEKI